MEKIKIRVYIESIVKKCCKDNNIEVSYYNSEEYKSNDAFTPNLIIDAISDFIDELSKSSQHIITENFLILEDESGEFIVIDAHPNDVSVIQAICVARGILTQISDGKEMKDAFCISAPL